MFASQKFGKPVTTLDEKKVKFTYSTTQKHWVGDGFHVYKILRPSKVLNQYINPFILMDYAAPKKYEPTTKRRGVGEHPHRGFETVTFAYQGGVEHRDSAGGGGVIQPGDIQWMTAGSGVVHEEFHSAEFSHSGGVFEMVQLWVNLPSKYKMTTPKYQGIKSKDIPVVSVGQHSKVRVYAGQLDGVQGPASTFTTINMYDIIGVSSDSIKIEVAENTNTILLILKGQIHIQEQLYPQHSMLIFERNGTKLVFDTSDDFQCLLLNGVPFDEPIVQHGPFVMNTQEEITAAIRDYQNGKMGKLNLSV